MRSIEDRPATVVNKIWVLTGSDIINGRCDIFAAPVHRLEQIERREIGSVQQEREVKGCPRLDAGRASLPQTSSWTSARRSRLFEIATEAFRDTKNFGSHGIEG